MEDYGKYKLLFSVVRLHRQEYQLGVSSCIFSASPLNFGTTDSELFDMTGWIQQQDYRICAASRRFFLRTPLTVHRALLSFRYGTSQLYKGSWHSPDVQRRCAFLPTSSAPSSSSSSSYSPGCRLRQAASSPVQPQSSRGLRLSKVSFAKGSS